jgi:hypothetical protein
MCTNWWPRFWRAPRPGLPRAMLRACCPPAGLLAPCPGHGLSGLGPPLRAAQRGSDGRPPGSSGALHIPATAEGGWHPSRGPSGVATPSRDSSHGPSVVAVPCAPRRRRSGPSDSIGPTRMSRCPCGPLLPPQEGGCLTSDLAALLSVARTAGAAAIRSPSWLARLQRDRSDPPRAVAVALAAPRLITRRRRRRRGTSEPAHLAHAVHAAGPHLALLATPPERAASRARRRSGAPAGRDGPGWVGPSRAGPLPAD